MEAVVSMISFESGYTDHKIFGHAQVGAATRGEARGDDSGMAGRLIETRLSTIPLFLTPREYGLLKVLALGGGKTFSREELINRAWGPGLHLTPRSVDVYVSKLRRKIQSASRESHDIETVWGVGYRLRLDRISRR